MMQQALRPYAVAGIAILSTGSFLAFAPAARSLHDVPAVQLTTDASPLGDLSSLFSDLTGATSGTGGIGDLSGDLTGLLGGLNPSSLLSDLPGLGSLTSTDPTGILGDLLGGLGVGSVGTDVTAPDPTSLLTPWETLFTDTFTNLSAIGTEWLKDPAPVLMALLANPSLITDLPSAVFSTLSTPLTITTSDLTSVPLTLPIMIDIMLGAPLVLGLGAVGPLATTSGALETFYADLISGNPTTVLTALIDGPANIANAYLNGSVGLPDVLGEPLNLLNGILVPDGNFDVTVGTDLITQLLTALNVDPTLIAPIISFLDGLPTGDLATISVGPFGGLADALINYVPQQIAAALTADPTTDGTGLLSVLDPSTLLSGLDLGNLGGLLDPSTLVGDLTALLPSAAADLPAGLADLATAIPF